MRHFLKALSFVVSLLPATLCAAEIQGKVIRVLDGDTIEVLQDKQDKKPVRIRLANIDAPEKKQAAVSEERAIRCANRLIQCKG